MNKSGAVGGNETLLRTLGIDEDEERVYRMLLVNRTATADEAAVALILPIRSAQNLLQRAEAKGLVSHSPERPRRYIPTRPEVGIESLIRQQQALLEHARAAIPELKSLMLGAAEQSDQLELVEIITNRPALGRVIEELQQTHSKNAAVHSVAPA